MTDKNETAPCGPCAPSKMSLVGKRIVVMGRHYNGTTMPMSVHDSLDNAIADLGKRSAECLVSWCDTAANAFYLVVVDR